MSFFTVVHGYNDLFLSLAIGSEYLGTEFDMFLVHLDRPMYTCMTQDSKDVQLGK